MRTSRLLSRLRHHRYHYSPFTCSIAQIHISCPSTEPENPTLQENKFINHPRLLHCDISIPPRFSQRLGFASFRNFLAANSSSGAVRLSNLILPSSSYHQQLHFTRGLLTRAKKIEKIEVDDHGQRAVTTALWCNFLVFSLKFGVWLSTSSHVMLAEVVHSVADFANQALLAYGLSSSRRAPDALHPYGYSKERFVWSLISAVGIFCLGSGATIVHGVQNLWTCQPPEHIEYAALVIGGSFVIEGASLFVAVNAVRKGAAAEGMKDGAAVTGLAIAAASLVAVKTTGNAIYDPIGSIIVGNLLGMVAIFLIQRNRHALIGRAIDDNDMERVLHFLKNDPVVDAVYDCKSEVIGPGFFRFKAEIDFNGVVLVQNYLSRTGREEWAKQFREAAKEKDNSALLKVMANYGTVCSIASFLSYYSARTKSCVLAGEEVVTALGSEVDRLEKEIQEIVPGLHDKGYWNLVSLCYNPYLPMYLRMLCTHGLLCLFSGEDPKWAHRH
ncbi:UNVERIFIED_CONTAM: Metal tolerance protein C4 [Sesamum calycinum]|uniref:Metal tolerance protein C4 n=1 Tax=Sesamum calycinum TaxID=2727403 RepID=A0AAW2NDH3_9LAMI